MIFGFNTAAARRWAELVTRLFGIESDDVPLPPGFILELERPEWAFLKRELLWTTTDVSIVASAGNLSRLQIHNPTGSNRVVVVEGFVVRNSPAGITSYLVTRDGALAGTPTSNRALDTRVPVAAAVRPVMSLNRIDNSLPATSGERVDARTTNAAGQDAIFNFRVGPCRPIILAPGTVCEVICGTVNTLLLAFGFGYERPATPDELAQ